jgi:hypothetical protein
MCVLARSQVLALGGSCRRPRADQDATDYFRAVVQSGETSARVLELTESVITQNPAHYSAW